MHHPSEKKYLEYRDSKLIVYFDGMRKCLLFLLTISFFCSCTPDYSEDIVGWWTSEDATKSSFVYYIIREDGTYKKRMKSNFFGVSLDGTERGTWIIDSSHITFNVLTYNGKEQNGRKETYKIQYLKNKTLILETEDGNHFVYINSD